MIRDDGPLADGAILVRALFDVEPGDRPFDRQTLVDDATFNFDLFGYYGLSVWAFSDRWPLSRVLLEKTRRAGHVVVFSAADLQQRSLGLVPSGRDPHYDIVLGRVYGRLFGGAEAQAVSADGLVVFRQVSAREAAAFGDLAVAAPA
jgi:hypothetical protein